MEFWQISLQYIFLTGNYLQFLKKLFSDHFHVYICISATCSISGRSGTNLTMAIPQPEIIQMFRNWDIGYFIGIDYKYEIRFQILTITYLLSSEQ